MDRDSSHYDILISDNKYLDQSYIEVAIYSLFKTDIVAYIKAKAILAKEFHIQPSEIDNMPVWEFEIFAQSINEAVKDENDRQKAEMDKAGISDAKKMADTNNITKMQKAATPQMPQMPKMPTVITPKF